MFWSLTTLSPAARPAKVDQPGPGCPLHLTASGRETEEEAEDEREWCLSADGADGRRPSPGENSRHPSYINFPSPFSPLPRRGSGNPAGRGGRRSLAP